MFQSFDHFKIDSIKVYLLNKLCEQVARIIWCSLATNPIDGVTSASILYDKPLICLGESIPTPTVTRVTTQWLGAVRGTLLSDTDLNKCLLSDSCACPPVGWLPYIFSGTFNRHKFWFTYLLTTSILSLIFSVLFCFDFISLIGTIDRTSQNFIN